LASAARIRAKRAIAASMARTVSATDPFSSTCGMTSGTSIIALHEILDNRARPKEMEKKA
jgi:hypothetical protein